MNKIESLYPVPVENILPDFNTDKIYSVESDTTPDRYYKVSPRGMTCDCKDFTEYRIQFPNKSIKRPCKHLRRVIVESNLLNNSPIIPLLTDSFLYQHLFIEKNLDGIFAYTIGKEWINYFGLFRGEYQKFGYNLVEDRWAYRQLPDNEFDVIKIIKKYFPCGSAFPTKSFKNDKLIAKIAVSISFEQQKVMEEFYELTSSIIADDHLDDHELNSLFKFCGDNADYFDKSPLIELGVLLMRIIKDKRIDQEERDYLLSFLKYVSTNFFKS